MAIICNTSSKNATFQLGTLNQCFFLIVIISASKICIFFLGFLSQYLIIIILIGFTYLETVLKDFVFK